MMNKANISLLISTLLFSSALPALTLEESVNEVLATNPAVQERLKNYQATLEDLRIAKSGYYPRIDLQSGIGHEKAKFHNKNYDDTDYSVYENSLTLTQNLFNGYGTSKLVEFQKNRIMAASYFYIEKANDAAFQMVNAYVELIRHKELVEVVKQNLASNLEIYEKVKSLYDNGLTTLSEVEKINSSVSLARSNVVVQQNNLMDAEFNFQRVLGRAPVLNNLQVPQFNASLPKTLEEASQLAIQNNPSVLVTNYNIEGEKALLEQKRSTYYPSVDLQLSQQYNKNYSEEVADTKEDKLRAMLVLRYNFYNGGADRAEIKKQVKVINQQQDTQQDLKRQVSQSMELSWSAYTMLEKQLTHLYNYRDFSLKTLELYEEEYDFGKRTLLDLLAAQNDYDSAQQEIITAKYKHLLAKYRILDAMGTMVTSIFDTQSEYLQPVGIGEEKNNNEESPSTDTSSEEKKQTTANANSEGETNSSVSSATDLNIDSLCQNSIYLNSKQNNGCGNISESQAYRYRYRFGAFQFTEATPETAIETTQESDSLISLPSFSGVGNFFSQLLSSDEGVADEGSTDKALTDKELTDKGSNDDKVNDKQSSDVETTSLADTQIKPEKTWQLNATSEKRLEQLLSFLAQAQEIESIEVVEELAEGSMLSPQSHSEFIKQQMVTQGITESLIEIKPSTRSKAQSNWVEDSETEPRVEVLVYLKKPLETAAFSN